MRIELNAGGLGSGASIDNMQTNIAALIGRSNTLISAFNNIKTYMYNVNGGVGGLSDALSGVQSRIQSEETSADNLSAARDRIDSFIELTRQTDASVTNTVSKNQAEFLKMNPWARPELRYDDDDDKEWYENVWDWLCDTGEAVADTSQEIWDSITTGFDRVADWGEDKFYDLREWWEDITSITPTEINNTVFNSDDPGYYGGDQMVFEDIIADSEEWNEMYEIFRKNNPDIELLDPEFQSYLEKLTDEGCGYVAICNTIFEQYEGRADEFEATFGYPMYTSDDHLNYTALEMDMYSQLDNAVPFGFFNYLGDYDKEVDGSIFNYNYWSDNTGNGTDAFDCEYCLETFMSEYGVDVNVTTDALVTVNNYDDIVASGKCVIVGLDDGNLYNMDGSVAQEIGSHWMTVTGVTEDGMFIVSSWGEKYYIDPSENSFSGQSMEFMTVEYE